MRFFGLVCIVVCVVGCRVADPKPHCDKLRACCAALKAVESNGAPAEHQILCSTNPEHDEGCVETLDDITKYMAGSTLPPACK